MLVLTRKQNEKIRIGDSITITVLRMKGKAVRLGIEAPHEVNVIRGELCFELTEDETGQAGVTSGEGSDARVAPRNAGKPTRSGIVEEATSHWPLEDRGEHALAHVGCGLPTGSSPLKKMVEARVH